MAIRRVRLVRWSICMVLMLLPMLLAGVGSAVVEVESMVALLAGGVWDWGGLSSSMAGGQS
jgi:hypothetical protein